MANLDIGNRERVVDKRAGRGNTTNPITADASIKDITATRARLTAINAGYFTSARLDKMTKNDMLMAIRINDDNAGIK